ncbi:MAG: tRNA 2-thiouridine(34) synthase MnmA [Anaerolineaceae bacterium]
MDGKKNSKKVFVAMSGGVDSSVTAACLVEQGYEVTGVMLKLWKANPTADNSEEPESKAREVARMLGIPFKVVDAREIFHQKIVNYFLESHRNGITPNPCFVCNAHIKWGLLLDYVLEAGGEYLATGHYARVKSDENGFFELWQGIDPQKDQSYVLAGLTQHQLAHALLPLGEITKSQTREIARRYEFNFQEVKESQDLCFLSGWDQNRFLEKYSPDLFVPGEIVTVEGQVIGTHIGLANYTIGQRKGIGSGFKEPLYVLKKNVSTNQIIVGTKKDLGQTKVLLRDIHWVSGEAPSLPASFQVKIRYKANPVSATLSKTEANECDMIFNQVVRDPTPGQYAVFYHGEQVIGSGVISN